MLIQFELSELKSSNITNPVTDSNLLITSKVCQNQATACRAMVARHTKNCDIFSCHEGDVVKLQLSKGFRKL
jgi:hypothetical protein